MECFIHDFLTRNIRAALLGTVLLCYFSVAGATCASVSAAINNASPVNGSIVVVGGQSGAVVWTGNLDVTVNGCSAKVYVDSPAAQGQYVALTNAPGLAAVVSSTPTLLAATSCTRGTDFNWTGGNQYQFQLNAGCVSATIRFPMAIEVSNTAAATANTGSPVVDPTHFSGAFAGGWIATFDSGSNTPVIYPGTSGFGLTFVSPQCTVAPASIPVTLNSISSADLALPNSAGPLTPFAIGFSSCNSTTALPAVAYNATLTWQFTQLDGSTPTVIKNSGTAANVGAQLLDSNRNVISNGATTTISGFGSATSLSTTYFARMYSKTGSAGGGTVGAIATFNALYN